jgi:hypothetical protein
MKEHKESELLLEGEVVLDKFPKAGFILPAKEISAGNEAERIERELNSTPKSELHKQQS